jgi:hypothetical protein
MYYSLRKRGFSMAYSRKRGDKWSFTIDTGVDNQGKRKQKVVSRQKRRLKTRQQQFKKI